MLYGLASDGGHIPRTEQIRQVKPYCDSELSFRSDSFPQQMPSREKELRVVPTTAAPGATSPGLRVLKTVTATDGGKYVIPMPGLLPAGLHISFHPSGEIHLKGRDFETVARIDLQRVVSGLLTGSLDSTFVKLLRTPEPGKRALGVICYFLFSCARLHSIVYYPTYKMYRSSDTCRHQ